MMINTVEGIVGIDLNNKMVAELQMLFIIAIWISYCLCSAFHPNTHFMWEKI